MKTLTALELLIFASTVPLSAQLPAFPGAEGGGMHTRGGRGGTVLEVITLFDTIATNVVGTLRWAVNQSGARTVVFRVSGTITLAADLKVSKDSITIAGQTAPGDGICLRKYPLIVSANEVIIRFLRVRLGNESGGESDAMSGFTNGGTPKHHIIVDHCSASWSVDEAFSFYGNDYVTVQWCLISESLYNSSHPKGNHGYGGIWGGADHTTFHHNLIAHHTSRTPRISGSSTTVGSFNLDLRNNVIYNWGFNSAYGGEGGTANFVNNFYKPGPATKSGVRSRLFNPYDTLGRFYIDGNVVIGSSAITADNWAGGVVPQVSPANLLTLKAPTPFLALPVTTESGTDAYTRVLAHAGATLPKRDTIDARIVYETSTGTATYGGTTYPRLQGWDTTMAYGIIDLPSNVGGWPTLNSLPAPTDTDHDGMPDDWETAHSLNSNDASDRNLTGPSGYTRLEEYLNERGNDGTTSIHEPEFVPAAVTLEQNFPNPFNPRTTIQFSVAVDGPAALTVYNLLGQPVATLFHGPAISGHLYSTQFDGAHLPTGVYVARLETNESVQTRRLTLIK